METQESRAIERYKRIRKDHMKQLKVMRQVFMDIKWKANRAIELLEKAYSETHIPMVDVEQFLEKYGSKKRE